jgi:hypothetical protein
MKKSVRTNRILTGRLLRRSCSVFIIIIFFNNWLFSQQSYDKTADEVRNFKEELFVRTDRDIYIIGEEVNLKIYKLNGLTEDPSGVSKVIYLELLDKNNFPLRQIKVKTDKVSGFSSFVLPENISSGNYIIRAYTSWMRNFTSDRFFYKTISVINPFESLDHLKIPADGISVSRAESAGGKLVSGLTYEDGNPVKGRLSEKRDQIRYKISLEKPAYSSREKVKIEISATDMAGNPVASDLSVSVAKNCVVNSDGSDSFCLIAEKDEKMARIPGPEHLAELEGHLLSGFLRLKTTDEPLKKTDLSLSFVGKVAKCQFGKTDDNGEFNFIIKEPGLNEIVIQPLSADITGYYVELSQPFSSSFSKFKSAGFYLDSSKIDEINKVIIGMQVNNIYQPFRQKAADESKIAMPDFYGKPENTIKMDDYIELTSLREVVKEIIPNVYTLKQGGKYDFKLINKFRGQPFENKPLILVDGVPVFDFEKVLNINSRDIEKVDVINTRYFFSENVFDGIVSFVTKKGNLSVMEFDNSVFRQVYEGCQKQNVFYSPDYSSAEVRKSRIADYRNTLYWKPDLQTGKDGNAEVSFFTSDESSDYLIVVEGITADGKRGYSTAVLKVE